MAYSADTINLKYSRICGMHAMLICCGVRCACAVCTGLPTGPLVNATWPEECRNTAVNNFCISKVSTTL